MTKIDGDKMRWLDGVTSQSSGDEATAQDVCQPAPWMTLGTPRLVLLYAMTVGSILGGPGTLPAQETDSKYREIPEAVMCPRCSIRATQLVTIGADSDTV
ncbi:MAG: hypothetical protein ACT4OZ_04835, partial [Gemmatimonadota bacterium]